MSPVSRDRARRLLVAAAVTALLTSSLGWLSRAPYHPPGTDAAFVRLSWRLRTAAVESCRQRSTAELEALPVHMRSPEICDRRPVRYRLAFGVDDEMPVTSTIVSGGMKGDRPIYVMREFSSAPGQRRILVALDPDSAARSSGAPSFRLDTVLHLRAGRVHLVTLDPAARALVVRASSMP